MSFFPGSHGAHFHATKHTEEKILGGQKHSSKSKPCKQSMCSSAETRVCNWALVVLLIEAGERGLVAAFPGLFLAKNTAWEQG